MADATSRYIYVTYIRTTPQAVWAALTNPETMKGYWFGVSIQTDWKPGSPWTMVHADGRVTDTGEILECDPPRRILLKWRNEFRPELKAEGYALCAMDIEPQEGAKDGAVKLTITHTIERADSKLIEAVSGGWPRILSNLKSLLETGEVVLT
jgi:uncharacterized protein YndB with AHSA1/START domain